VAQAYLTIHQHLPEFWRAMVKHPHFKFLCEDDPGFSLAERLVRVPARWEFQHINVFGEVGDAMTTAGRYAASKVFLTVHPIAPGDPWCADWRKQPRVPYIHKPTSPFRITYVRKNELRAQLRGYSPLVNHAKGMNKSEFLEQFAAKPGTETKHVDRRGQPYTLRKRVPDMTPFKLLLLTGYTVEEFWQEVHNPRTKTPRFPQPELAL
jgi:hypothetical protein